MNALIAAAKKEGQLNVTAWPDTWANYGAIMARPAVLASARDRLFERRVPVRSS